MTETQITCQTPSKPDIAYSRYTGKTASRSVHQDIQISQQYSKVIQTTLNTKKITVPMIPCAIIFE